MLIFQKPQETRADIGPRSVVLLRQTNKNAQVTLEFSDGPRLEECEAHGTLSASNRLLIEMWTFKALLVGRDERPGSWGGAQLAEHLPSIHKDLGLVPCTA